MKKIFFLVMFFANNFSAQNLHQVNYSATKPYDEILSQNLHKLFLNSANICVKNSRQSRYIYHLIIADSIVSNVKIMIFDKGWVCDSDTLLTNEVLKYFTFNTEKPLIKYIVQNNNNSQIFLKIYYNENNEITVQCFYDTSPKGFQEFLEQQKKIGPRKRNGDF
jgi:CMP-N-acetylneuraminic acid synthetase